MDPTILIEKEAMPGEFLRFRVSTVLKLKQNTFSRKGNAPKTPIAGYQVIVLK